MEEGGGLYRETDDWNVPVCFVGFILNDGERGEDEEGEGEKAGEEGGWRPHGCYCCWWRASRWRVLFEAYGGSVD